MEELKLTDEEIWNILKPRQARVYRNHRLALREVAEAQVRKAASVILAQLYKWANDEETAHWVAASLQGEIFESEGAIKPWLVNEKEEAV